LQLSVFLCTRNLLNDLLPDLLCVVGYGQQQQATAYIQQPPAQHVQVQVQPPSAQPASAYGVAAAQQAYGQPSMMGAGQPTAAGYTQQLPPPQGQPAGQQTVLYGQPPTQQGIPSYMQPQQAPGYPQPVAQAAAATAYGQPAPGQAPVYGQPQVQQAMSQLPPPQQTAVYMIPAAAPPQPSQYGIPPPSQQPPVAAYRPTLTGRPVSPVDLVPYDQRPLNLPPAGGRGPPPGALLGPSVVLNAGMTVRHSFRVTTYLEHLEMSHNLTAVREMSGILLKVREMSGKNLVNEKWLKTVYCKLHICVHTGI